MDLVYDRGECEKFQLLYGNTDRDWISKRTGLIRRANTEWNGVNEVIPYQTNEQKRLFNLLYGNSYHEKKQSYNYSHNNNEKLSPEARQEKMACENPNDPNDKYDTRTFSCFQLAIKYEKGKGVRKSKANALKYYKKACNLGDLLACKEYKRAEKRM
jgi:hypothetical protein